MAQSGVSYDSTTNKARVRVTITPTNAVDPWRYVVAVRGTTVVSGSVTGSSVAVTITNDCSITTQSVTSTITDAQNRTASAASTLDRSLCPPPPDYPHARDHIIAGPTLNVLVRDTDKNANLAPSAVEKVLDSGHTRVSMYPGFVLGVEI